MVTTRNIRPWASAGGALIATLLALAGCATSKVTAQWSDPQFAGQPQRGAKVFVACQASDLTLRRVCADRLAARLSALGAVPILASDAGDAGASPSTDMLLLLARSAGAVTLLNTSVTPEVAVASPGPSIGIGIGGFGGGYRGGGGGGIGFGMSAPLAGAGSVETGYSANAALTDVASGRLMWSARASAPPSSDVGEQLSTLAAILLESAHQAGLFPA